jgi:hypothetical protein
MQQVAVGLRVVRGGGAARLHRRHGDALVDEAYAGHMCGAGEDRIELGAFLGLGAERMPVDGEIALRLRPDLRHAGLRCTGDIGHRIARRVVNLDQFGGVARLCLRLGDDQRHRVADMARAIASK